MANRHTGRVSLRQANAFAIWLKAIAAKVAPDATARVAGLGSEPQRQPEKCRTATNVPSAHAASVTRG